VTLQKRTLKQINWKRMVAAGGGHEHELLKLSYTTEKKHQTDQLETHGGGRRLA
jgi:hypothetical protein